MNEKIIDFVNTSGKNIGKVQNTKLANFLDTSEGAIRTLRKKDILKFDCLYLGAFCKANKITKQDLVNLLTEKKNEEN